MTGEPGEVRGVTIERVVNHLVLARESGLDEILMGGMLQQTLRKAFHLAGAAELLAAGMDVFHNPIRYGAILKRVGKSRIVLVQREDVIYMFSMGSAAANDVDDTNAFVRELVNVIVEFRPRELWTQAFTRMVRSAEWAGDLLKACEVVEKIHCETEISPATPEGKLIFQVLAMIAAAERDYIVRRHTAGRVAQWRRGEWLLSGYPPGYKLGKDRVLRLDHDSIDAVKELLLLFADLSNSPTQIAQRCAALGITTAMLKNMYGDDATIADARNPSQAVTTMLGWMEALRTGRYVLTWRNPFPGVDNISGIPVQAVVEKDDCPHGVLAMSYNIELPEGGWADERIFDLIDQRIAQSTMSPDGGYAHKVTGPFSGFFNSTSDGYEHILIAGTKTTYHLKRRAIDEERRFSGWKAQQDESTVIATMSRRDLHNCVANEIQDAIRRGLPASLDKSRLVVGGTTTGASSASLTRSLERKLAATTKSLDRARRNANQADDDAAAELFIEDVKRLAADQQQLNSELAQMRKLEKTPTLGHTFETNAALVAHALNALRNVETSGSNELRSALRTVISNESMSIDDGKVFWSLCIELPHADGTITLGPITGSVENIRRWNYTEKVRQERGPGPNLRRENRKNKIAYFKTKGVGALAASCAVKCEHPDLLLAIESALDKSPLPKHIDKHWAQHVQKVYLSADFAWERHKWRQIDGLRQHLLDSIGELGGSATAEDLLKYSINAHQLRHLSRKTDAPSGAPIVTISGSRAQRMYNLIACPHCEGHASESVVTPETSGGVMCPECMKTPDANSPKFPAWYLTRQPSKKTTETEP
jgi:hypothetical protein